MTQFLPEQIYNADDGISSPATRQAYRIVFRLFIRHLQKQPEELLQQHPRTIQPQIIDYIRLLSEERHYQRGSINTPLCAIFHFYEMNDIILNKRKIKRFLQPDESTKQEDRAYTQKKIRQMLLKCDERSRVLILLMTSTGMRKGAL
jgi:hypothetical protein